MKTNSFLVLLLLVLVAGIFKSCNDAEPAPLTIEAKVPESLILKGSSPIVDTFGFSIQSAEAVIDSVQLLEGNTMYVGLGAEDFGADKRELKLNLIYRPISSGVKEFTLIVKAPPYERRYSFTIHVNN